MIIRVADGEIENVTWGTQVWTLVDGIPTQHRILDVSKDGLDLALGGYFVKAELCYLSKEKCVRVARSLLELDKKQLETMQARLGAVEEWLQEHDEKQTQTKKGNQ